MAEKTPISEELIAPCGMNCAICSKYLAYKNGLKRSQCVGCRARNQPCTYLFAKCTGINHGAKGEEAAFCFECAQYPCKQTKRMDHRYQGSYHMSTRENLDVIQQKGTRAFLKEQYEKYRCLDCGGLISIHNQKCFNCETITRLVEKQPKE